MAITSQGSVRKFGLSSCNKMPTCTVTSSQGSLCIFKQNNNMVAIITIIVAGFLG